MNQPVMYKLKVISVFEGLISILFSSGKICLNSSFSEAANKLNSLSHTHTHIYTHIYFTERPCVTQVNR